mmetsp:Transcript_1468/g.1752  ORF Transcript_1468/g.1752 Transcript_1468/m.1752 type:complete len:83 (-) Transcript_1468:383-631(-)
MPIIVERNSLYGFNLAKVNNEMARGSFSNLSPVCLRLHWSLKACRKIESIYILSEASSENVIGMGCNEQSMFIADFPVVEPG